MFHLVNKPKFQIFYESTIGKVVFPGILIAIQILKNKQAVTTNISLVLLSWMFIIFIFIDIWETYKRIKYKNLMLKEFDSKTLIYSQGNLVVKVNFSEIIKIEHHIFQEKILFWLSNDEKKKLHLSGIKNDKEFVGQLKEIALNNTIPFRMRF